MRIFRTITFLIIALLPFLAEQAYGQVLYGSIVGSVTDATGASVPGATVKITQTETNQSREVKSNDSGGYTISTVPAGTFEVAISKEGFRTHSAKGIIVRLNTVVRVDASLQVGAVSESVAVSAQAASLQTDKADVRSEVTTTTLINLPQPTRTYQGVFQLLPGVAPPSASSGGTNNPSRSMQVSANGTSRSGTNVRVDGVSATNPWVQFFSLYVPSIEAIETVNVVTNSADAEQGMANGAAVNVSLKSGTNDFHGALFEYNQISGLAARNFFLPANQGIAKLVDNDFGGALGGRIIRDKLFFFGSYEVDLLRQAAANTTTVPTDAIKSGDMSGSPNAIYDPLTGTATGTGRTPFAGNIVPAARQSSIVRKLTALVPSPNVAGLANNYFINTPSLYNLHKIDTKFDWNATDKLRLSFRVADQPYKNLRDTVFGPVLSGGNNHIQDGYTFAYSTSATYVASATLVLDATFALMKNIQNLFPPLADQKYGLDVLGIPGVNVGDLPLAGGMPNFNVSSYGGYGYAYPPLVYGQTVLEYTGNATWVKGPHNIRFGVDLNHQSMDQKEIGPTAFAFTGGITALNGGPSPNQFNSYADFLLGLPQNKGINILPEGERTLRTWQHSLYVRDQWQVNRKFTMSLGLRWEYYPVPTRRNRQIENYDVATNKVLICGAGSNPTNCGIQTSKKIFAPRIGLAFRPTDTFVIRAGYALSPEQINMYRDAIGSYPISMYWSDTGANSFSAVSPLAQGIPAVPLPNISSGSVSLPAGVNTVFLPQKFVRGYVQSWNFTIQKQLGHGWAGQVGYVGTNTIHQHTRYNLNYGLPGGGAASQPFFPLGITGAMTLITPNETMSYNSLQASLERRFSNGVQFMASYTRSKWLGTCCDDSGDGAPAIPIPQYWNLNRALMGQDRPHNLRLSGIYELPFGKGKKMLADAGAASYIAGGWQLNGVISAYSGSPFSISAAGASLNAPGSTQRADQMKQDVQYLGGIGDAPFFDPLAFAAVTTARFGTAGFNTMRGPGVVNLDLGVFRNFKLTERVALQFRGEAMNATNTPHFSNPGGNVSNMLLNADGSIRSLGGYAQVRGTSAPSRLIDERYFRFGLRLSF